LTLTRPDMSFAIQHLNQFLQEPREAHLHATKHVLRYLQGTANTGLFYAESNPLQQGGLKYL